jgi:flagellar hook protein FlgE
MSISGAMQTGIAGLQANSQSISRISENIANANTDGYRRSFAHMVTRANGTQAAELPSLSVRAVEMTEISASGTIRSTGRPYDIAISGDGFFAVTPLPQAEITNDFVLTRAGSFNMTGDGYLQNAAGFFLQGYPYADDGTLGAVDRSGFRDVVPVNVGNTTMRAQPTTEISLAGNLPAQAAGVASPGDPFVSFATFYTPTQDARQLEFSWQPSSTADQWTLTVTDPSGLDVGSIDVTYDPFGDLAGAPQSYSNVVDLSGTGVFSANPATGELTLNLPTAAGGVQPITVPLGAPGTFDGVTQFSGSFQPLTVNADGNAFGNMIRTEFDAAGDLFGVFDNGMRKALFNIPVVRVEAPNNLRVLDGNTFGLSADSGSFSLLESGDTGVGRLVSGSLEGSNVDIAEELTGLIQTQRAFSSNAKVITTSDEMIDEALRMKR